MLSADECKGRILVVDDEKSVRQMLRQWLESEGYATQDAADFATLRRLMAAQTFDLITLDVRMPGVDGLEVLDWLAKCHPETGAVMATVQDDLPTVIGAMRQGAIGYLLKPFDLELVSQEIGRAVERQRLVAENRARRLELEWLVAERSRQLQQTQIRLARQVRELEGRDRLVRLQMDPPAEMREAFAAIAAVAAQATGAARVIIWQADGSGAHLEQVASSGPSDPQEGAEACDEGETGRLPIGNSDLLPVRVFRERRPDTGRRGEAAAPILYREAALGVLQAAGLPEEEGLLDALWRLGREAALLLRMVQVAQDLEQEEPALGALLGADPLPWTGEEPWPES